MRSWTIRIIKVSAVLITVLLALSLPAQAEKPLEASRLVAALKQGGYIIYIRHAATDHSSTDTDRDDLRDWTHQRLLSDHGRNQSVVIGKAFRSLGIPVSQVISSPYCRSIETAKLAFGKATVSNDLAFSIGVAEKEAKRLAQALGKMLGTQPRAGANTVVVAHSANLKEAANIWPKPEGVAFIFKPLGNANFEMVGKVEPQQWAEFAEKMGVPIGAPLTKEQLSQLPDRGALCRRQDARIH